MLKLPHLTFGYTLIEILVVLSIMGLLFGAGYANLRGFQRRQSLSDAAKQVQGDLRYAQELALSGQKPSNVNCTGANNLNGYLFTVLSSSNSYEIRASCTGAVPPPASKSVTLPVGLSITSTLSSLLFKVLGNGTNNATISVSQQGNSVPVTITVSSGGQIQ